MKSMCDCFLNSFCLTNSVCTRNVRYILEIGLLPFVFIDGNRVMKRTFTRDFISLFYGGEMTHKTLNLSFVKVVYMAQMIKNY